MGSVMTYPSLSVIPAICLAGFQIEHHTVYLLPSDFVLFFTSVFTRQETFQLSNLLQTYPILGFIFITLHQHSISLCLCGRG